MAHRPGGESFSSFGKPASHLLKTSQSLQTPPLPGHSDHGPAPTHFNTLEYYHLLDPGASCLQAIWYGAGPQAQGTSFPLHPTLVWVFETKPECAPSWRALPISPSASTEPPRRPPHWPPSQYAATDARPLAPGFGLGPPGWVGRPARIYLWRRNRSAPPCAFLALLAHRTVFLFASVWPFLAFRGPNTPEGVCRKPNLIPAGVA